VRRDLPPLARLAALSQLAIDFDMESERPGSGSANEYAVA